MRQAEYRRQRRAPRRLTRRVIGRFVGDPRAVLADRVSGEQLAEDLSGRYGLGHRVEFVAEFHGDGHDRSLVLTGVILKEMCLEVS